ncbi:hypothetical protein [Nocardia nepalensis]|uniref:hypothetical protein n=1 Tax=Nocardia nepalensis TaxID=3375448 RepID=UPI003B67BE6A
MRQGHPGGSEGRGTPVQHYQDNFQQISNGNAEFWRVGEPWPQAVSPFDNSVENYDRHIAYDGGPDYFQGLGASQGYDSWHGR